MDFSSRTIKSLLRAIVLRKCSHRTKRCPAPFHVYSLRHRPCSSMYLESRILQLGVLTSCDALLAYTGGHRHRVPCAELLVGGRHGREDDGGQRGCHGRHGETPRAVSRLVFRAGMQYDAPGPTSCIWSTARHQMCPRNGRSILKQEVECASCGEATLLLGKR